jgi:hypothetical protein
MTASPRKVPDTVLDDREVPDVVVAEPDGVGVLADGVLADEVGVGVTPVAPPESDVAPGVWGATCTLTGIEADVEVW